MSKNFRIIIILIVLSALLSITVVGSQVSAAIGTHEIKINFYQALIWDDSDPDFWPFTNAGEWRFALYAGSLGNTGLTGVYSVNTAGGSVMVNFTDREVTGFVSPTTTSLTFNCYAVEEDFPPLNPDDVYPAWVTVSYPPSDYNVWIEGTVSTSNSRHYYRYWVTNVPPTANAGPDQTLEATGYDGAAVTLDGSGSSDPEGDSLTYDWSWSGGTATGVNPTIVLPVGTTTVKLTVSDSITSSEDYVDITVTDTQAPVISVSVSPDMLWPPNHKMVEITATVVVTDIADPSPLIMLDSITSNEPDDANGNGDGNTVNDIQDASIGTEDYDFLLRAERAGGNGGRIYTITYIAIDFSGNSASATATVVVPHDME